MGCWSTANLSCRPHWPWSSFRHWMPSCPDALFQGNHPLRHGSPIDDALSTEYIQSDCHGHQSTDHDISSGLSRLNASVILYNRDHYDTWAVGTSRSLTVLCYLAYTGTVRACNESYSSISSLPFTLAHHRRAIVVECEHMLHPHWLNLDAVGSYARPFPLSARLLFAESVLLP